MVRYERNTPTTVPSVSATSIQRGGSIPPRATTATRHASSAPATRLAHSASHWACGATARTDAPRSVARGRGGSRADLASSMVERELAQAALAVLEAFAERHARPGKLQAIDQAALLGEQHPAGQARQARLDAHPWRQALPVEPELGGGAAREELGQQRLAAGGGLPRDVARRIARAVGP